MKDVVNAHDIGPADFKLGLARVRFDDGLGCRWWRRAVLPAFVGKKGKGHAEYVDVFGIEQPIFGIDLVGGASQAAPNHLLTQQLAGEGPQAHDVRHRLGVPALVEHAHGDDLLDLFAWLPGLAHRVHRAAQ